MRHILYILLPILLIVPSNSMGLGLVLPDLDGKERSLDEFRGKWVLVNFWATWCSPCIREMPELEQFHQKHKDKDAVVVGVNIEDIDPERLKDFVVELGISYPILLASPDESAPFGPLTGLPTSYLISPKGDLAARQVGTITGKMIEHFMQQEVSGASVDD